MHRLRLIFHLIVGLLLLAGQAWSQIENFDVSQLQESAALETCRSDLLEIDENGDMRLDRDEYAAFLQLQTGNTMSGDFNSLPWRMDSVYFAAACMCVVVDPNDDECCLYGNDHIPLDASISSMIDPYLDFFCHSVQTGLVAEGFTISTPPPADSIKPVATPSQPPTSATSAPSVTPATPPSFTTESPSGLPSEIPTTPVPSSVPTGIPSSNPTRNPSRPPFTSTPSTYPSFAPTGMPTRNPSASPSASPSEPLETLCVDFQCKFVLIKSSYRSTHIQGKGNTLTRSSPTLFGRCRPKSSWIRCGCNIQ